MVGKTFAFGFVFVIFLEHANLAHTVMSRVDDGCEQPTTAIGLIEFLVGFFVPMSYTRVSCGRCGDLTWKDCVL
jgi:hypothetical protein